MQTTEEQAHLRLEIALLGARAHMPSNINSVLGEFRRIVGERYVSDKVEDLLPYCRDTFAPVAESLFGEPKIPLAVVCPADTQEVAETVRVANTHSLPMLPVTFGSNMGGLALPTVENSIVIDLMRMNKIIEINEGNMTATIQPAVSYGKLEQESEKHGLRTVCKIGGWTGGIIGNYLAANMRPFNARYGWTDPIVSLEIVLPTGDLLRTGSPAIEGANTHSRLSWGPDLTGIWRGSLGSFGIVTQAQIRLYPVGEMRDFLFYEFGSLESMLEATRGVQRNDIGVSAVGLDSVSIKEIMLSPEDSVDPTTCEEVAKMVSPTSWFLFIESEGFAKRVEAEKEQADLVCRKYGGRVVQYADKERMNYIIDTASNKGRRIMHHFNGDYVGITSCMAMVAVPEFIKKARPLFEEKFRNPRNPDRFSEPHWSIMPFDRGTTWACGWNITYNASTPGNVEKMKEVIQSSIFAALELGGTIPLTTRLLTGMMMPSYANLLREIKKALDPKNILVPDKIC